MAIVAELLVLGEPEVITLAEKPSSHACDTLIFLQAVRLQTWLTPLAGHTVFLVSIFVRAHRHEVECPCRALLEHEIVCRSCHPNLVRGEGLRLCRDVHIFDHIKLVMAV